MSAYEIAEEYMKKYSKKTGRFYKQDLKNHKWWEAFEKIEELFGFKGDFSPKEFIEANFEKFGLVYPYQLTTKKAYDAFLEYKKLKGEEKSEEVMLAEKISYFLRVLKLYTNKGKTVRDFVKENWDKIEKNHYDFYVLVFSKTFLEMNEGDKVLIEAYQVHAAMMRVMKYPRLMFVIKNVLEDDFYK